MNFSRALPTDTASEQKATGGLTAGSALQLSKSVLNFDQTDVGDESFLTLKIVSPRPNSLVVVSVKDPTLFQIAVGVERLAFKQTLTFKPAPGGTYIHLRYTPEQAGRHQSVLVVEAPVTAETITIPLLGHTGGLAAIGLPSVNLLPAGEPVVRRRNRGLLATLLVGSLVVGAGYVYRCQIWPASCGPSAGLSTSADNPSANQQAEPVRTIPTPAPIAVEPNPEPEQVETRSATGERTRLTSRTTEASSRRGKSRPDASEEEVSTRSKTDNRSFKREEVANATSDIQKKETERSTSDEESTDRKTAAKTKASAPQRTQPAPVAAKPKAVSKPSASEESELERILNKGSN